MPVLRIIIRCSTPVLIILTALIALMPRLLHTDDVIAFLRVVPVDATQSEQQLVIMDLARPLDYIVARNRTHDFVSLDWSPDGDTIVYGTRYPIQQTGLLDVRTGQATILKTDNSSQYYPKWGPSNDQIIVTMTTFNRARQVFTTDVYLMDTTGSVERITQAPARYLHPDWSPDGTQIVATIVSKAQPRTTDLYIINVNTVQMRQLTFTPDLNEQSGRWSPDGTHIAFTTSHMRYNLYVIDANGGEARLIAQNAEHAAWSPDSTRLLYRDVRDADLYIVALDGSPPRQVTHTSHITETMPIWKPR